MNKVKLLAALALAFTSTSIASATELSEISNEQLVLCANVSGVNGASITSRTAFRNYLVTERNYQYSLLVELEREYLTGITEVQQEQARKAYQEQCEKTGRQLYFKGF